MAKLPARLSSLFSDLVVSRLIISLVLLLTVGCQSTKQSSEPQLSPRQAAYDLKFLYNEIQERSPYLAIGGSNLKEAYATLLQQLEDRQTPVSLSAYTKLLLPFLAQLGDAHASIDGWRRALGSGFLPFLVEMVDDQFYAIREDRENFVEPNFPIIKSIDGLPVQHWFLAASKIVPGRTPQRVRHQGTRNLRYLEYLRSQLGVAHGTAVSIVFESRDKRRSRRRTFTVSKHRPLYGLWPRTKSKTLVKGRLKFGYLRLASMRESLAEKQMQSLVRLRDSHALIIDVRGNGGGSRKLTTLLAPHFLPPESQPKIGNVASYRRHRSILEGDLHDRVLYPLTSSMVSVAAKRFITKIFQFRPEFSLPSSEFSPLHYLTILPSNPPTHPFYSKPTAVLMDSGCFSATEIFLSSLQGLENITLMGRPSSGGSGRPRGFNLPNSQLRIRLSTMASFHPNGRSYDKHGVRPDLVSEAPAEFYIDRADPLLETAVSTLFKRFE